MGWKKTALALACSLMATISIADTSRNVPLLASTCAACHGTNGHSVGNMPPLAGISQRYFMDAMKAFQNGTRGATVMMHHARGYTDDEIKLLADFFAVQKQ